ncbi:MULTISPECIES: NAD(P)-dependent oxidoreductase [unclassified Pedobacter]|uniref:NAD(P)-dependent oxidoreductase n=1 Tax=unclassified Pedobacter TaxID=2628915 RepID=UPI001DAF22CA|nr:MULTISPECIES: NAD(P)-dependent oxidoreductase [unclassified Pedobacter]CAH0169856.1 2-hydroxy-3-oxopropionate reductase [Pedobacter sp. Bi126]CAH0287734.1 2-hydroxy-3-oxopropionate reductase [Pedobacter sp. Bi36]
MNTTKIGWIGLGNMGIPMAGQLIKAGYTVTVYNRSKDKEASLKEIGASIAETPKALIAATDVVIVMVSDDAAIEQIFKGEEGLFSIETSGKIIINMSTVSPSISKEMATQCKAKRNFYLDAPVSGSVKQAETGQLVIMVGGEEAAFNQVKPILEKMGKLAKLVGENGAGNSAKLAINSLLALYAQGLAETVLFANEQGIKTEDLLELINNAAIGNIFTKIKGDAIIADHYKAAFALKHIVKDLNLAKTEGISSPLAKTALNTFEDAAAKYGEEDIIAVIKQLKG